MDIILNQALAYEELHAFLASWPLLGQFFVLYPGISDWADIPQYQPIIQYLVNEEQPGPFKYGLSVFIDHPQPLRFIEQLAQDVSLAFSCSTLCDAARVVLQKNKTYYSLLYEDGQVYLVNDFDFEGSGEVTKIVSLSNEAQD